MPDPIVIARKRQRLSECLQIIKKKICHLELIHDSNHNPTNTGSPKLLIQVHFSTAMLLLHWASPTEFKLKHSSTQEFILF